MDEKIIKAYELACKVRKNAHAPYSRYFVGATLVANNGLMFTGCNVENKSYGGTICAERVAMVKAVSEQIKDFSDLVIVVDQKEIASPCGLCLQVLTEFCSPSLKIHLGNLEEIKESCVLGDFIPRPFKMDD